MFGRRSLPADLAWRGRFQPDWTRHAVSLPIGAAALLAAADVTRRGTQSSQFRAAFGLEGMLFSGMASVRFLPLRRVLASHASRYIAKLCSLLRREHNLRPQVPMYSGVFVAGVLCNTWLPVQHKIWRGGAYNMLSQAGIGSGYDVVSEFALDILCAFGLKKGERGAP